MRLTDENATREGTTIGFPKAVECYWKLKSLEDIEDDYGIELTTFFNAIQGTMTEDYIRHLIDMINRGYTNGKRIITIKRR